MKTTFLTLLVLFVGLVVASPMFQADDDETVEVSEKGQCDWTDPSCETWDPISCTCQDEGYVSQSEPWDDSPDVSGDKLSSREVKIRTRSTKGVKGFYSGKVKGNWIAVDTDAYQKAKQAIFKQLSADPRVSFGQVDDLSKKFRAKGQSWRWTGKVDKKKLSEQAHTDHGPFGQFKNWQGTRFYDFTFYFRVT
ncbi:hypothetical protein COH20_008555 [Aspergillus flavus]|uniref:DNA, SC038 n=1 Tax=Aspergillus oryzae (strain ATCC 42149 / RIB 40) TaxID=510516 RepID=Q2U3E4_ASPOR|nr:unnamed protein product [Aspergillus oryzae RIB40]RAQ67107.1 hypothetical protein COH21_012660 [Aspergillus flavus]RAQ75511.1 hypothetical protein COH20_008555 [Aspergillus flavus]BAE63921.1 unnamed protein product [Aspergillus oryzae RIB40]